MPDPYFSEVKFLGAGNQDFVEIALDAGTDPSTIQLVVYHPNGTVRTTNDLDSPDSSNAGKDIYSIDSAGSDTFNGVHKNGAIALVENGVVVQFISFESTLTPSNGPAAGMTSTALGGTAQGESLESTDGGGSYGVNTAPSKGTIPCFLAGTQIKSVGGETAVEDIVSGDQLETRDNGLQTVIWVGKRCLTLDESSDPKTRPIRIPAQALGAGAPHIDTYISPNHRVLISDHLCQQLFGSREVFIAAKFLLGHRGIGHAPVALPIWVHHVLFEHHEVITANGLPAESLFHGTVAAEGFSSEGSEVPTGLEGFTHHDSPARKVLKSGEAALLLRELEKQETFHLMVS
ncbi:Hint domain-containing protein [Cognatishimia activa]|uniref:Hint domain-containing protein n=1 Tax=Cognatishimia activa TaxID=1715691 RepID=UPI00222FDB45|nr:Hint domain-containing protein [Cognatishimia activa]UZD90231.1 Hint domain-containing protein [Cognatishimia activa]